ncbi:MAG TPA: D-alanyl-D-alanine carboxypeptidase/D-alanyl-D-alanine-endopeptidase [Streptosporangiaceae bacterium]|nr:D-alanyl-D-alanine carboxypeptidase/D-alanyl-D-alanine-endopeptidase [Streptosporangiaceae bacterium]
MANRVRLTVLAVLAMLSVFTLCAGVAVAALMPARLALWHIPRVAAARVAAPAAVLAPAVPSGALPTRAGLASELAPLIASPSLGSHVGVAVTDLASGSVLFARAAGAPATPASSAKVATGVAALSVLGAGARFTTRVVHGPAGSIVLVGGGDPTLAAGRVPASDYPQPATLASLASQTARWLRTHGQRSVRLTYDVSLFTGPLTAPGWTSSYVTTGNVTPITPLQVDQGRLTRSGKPEDADNPGNFRPRSFTPAADAAASFASFLRARGIRVDGRVTTTAAPKGAATLARVNSPSLSAIVSWMLRESNNVIAENLARHVALRTGRPASFAGAAAAVTAAAARLGVRRGIHLVDGSGLSPRDRITPMALAGLVRLAGGRQAVLRSAVTGMPVAGFSGTLAPGQSVFGHFGRAALGTVRAKTGNLTQVVSLAGIVSDASGRLLAFAFMADQLPRGQLVRAASVIDQMATALAGCGCRS